MALQKQYGTGNTNPILLIPRLGKRRQAIDQVATRTHRYSFSIKLNRKARVDEGKSARFVSCLRCNPNLRVVHR